MAENATPRPSRSREKKPADDSKVATTSPSSSTSALFAALAGLGTPPADAPRPVDGGPVAAGSPAPTAGPVDPVPQSDHADTDPPGDPEFSTPEVECSPGAEGRADVPDLAAHLDALGVKVDVVGLSTAPQPGSPAAPTPSAATPVDTLPLPVETDAAPGDVSAAMDHRALSVREGITVRVADAASPWEVDVARVDDSLSLSVRADQAVRSIIATEEASIRAAAARDGYHLGRIELTERLGPAVSAVNATAESANTSQTGSNLSHEQSSADARREELPTWPLPRRARAVTTTAPAPRAGRLDRDV